MNTAIETNSEPTVADLAGDHLALVQWRLSRVLRVSSNSRRPTRSSLSGPGRTHGGRKRIRIRSGTFANFAHAGSGVPLRTNWTVTSG